MAETPKNQTLSGSQAPVRPVQPVAPPPTDAYPKMLVHKDSTSDHLITKEVANAAEEAKLGADWTTLDETDLKTTPSAEEAAEESAKAAKKKS